MIIFRGDAESAVEKKSIVIAPIKKRIRDSKILTFFDAECALTREIDAVRLSEAVVGIYHDNFPWRC